MKGKKLFLESLELSESSLLSRTELKSIIGGSTDELRDGRDDSPGCSANGCGPHGNGTCKTGVSQSTKNCVCDGYPEANSACMP